LGGGDLACHAIASRLTVALREGWLATAEGLLDFCGDDVGSGSDFSISVFRVSAFKSVSIVSGQVLGDGRHFERS